MLWIVIGGQMGSEGKGAVIAWLATKGVPADLRVIGVRVGGPNAGHSVITRDSEVLKMRHVPCTFVNPDSPLFIARGALIDLEVLHEEIEAVEKAGYTLKGRLFIAPEAVIIQHEDRALEEAELRQRIGSTAEGVGAARAALVMRTARLACDESSLQRYLLPDMASLLRSESERSDSLVILETTQGFGLSLVASGFYPYCTSRDITPAQALNDVGIPASVRHEVVAVFRTFPIRVAGTSGPLKGETTWEALAEQTDGYIQPEQTTVTKKTRRVGTWDPEYNTKAVAELRPSWIALTFYDYVRPDLAGRGFLDVAARADIARREEELGVPIRWVSLGFQKVVEHVDIPWRPH